MCKFLYCLLGFRQVGSICSAVAYDRAQRFQREHLLKLSTYAGLKLVVASLLLLIAYDEFLLDAQKFELKLRAKGKKQSPNTLCKGLLLGQSATNFFKLRILRPIEDENLLCFTRGFNLCD
jgi:hypothetical protein